MFCASRINLTNQEINDSIIALKQKIKDKKFVHVDLIENKLKYNLLKGKWNKQLGEPVEQSYESKKKIELLKQQLKNKNEELNRLQKEYLAKTAKMLVMTHVHCDLKKRINDEFISLGLTQPIIIDRNIVYDNENNEDDSNNTKPIQSNYYEKEINYAE